MKAKEINDLNDPKADQDDEIMGGNVMVQTWHTTERDPDPI